MNEAKKYKSKQRRKLFLLLFSVLSLLLLSVYAISIGQFHLPLSRILENLLEPNGKAGVVMWNIRLPRVLGAIFIGASLSLAGNVLQSTLKNPVASPITLGISHGAMFGAAVAIMFLNLKIPYIVTISAFIGSLSSAFSILLLSRLKQLSAEAIILAGIALNMFFTAAVMFLQYFANEVQLSEIVYWSFGDVSRITWNALILQVAVFVLVFSFFLYKRWDLNTLSMGKEVAESLGVNVKELRLISFILTSLLVATCVSAIGIIPFLGLVAPHIARFIMGSDQGFLIPASCLVGAILLVASDIVSRLIIPPIVIPVGIVTSFVGVPLFLYLLVKMEGGNYR